ncbi:hypothetical protein EHP00_780 [Ecytonucleospora hepatopenaei]|uniref:Uncharacterized protein n=1 Tax=Ecytonucleospora hepatopenaei TaxID=646526 RepID=A0A1W0E7V8_9MICR|nr:hypothetical protein EHP00_780 [Ecytonucleospora hepatopenaei]
MTFPGVHYNAHMVFRGFTDGKQAEKNFNAMRNNRYRKNKLQRKRRPAFQKLVSPKKIENVTELPEEIITQDKNIAEISVYKNLPETTPVTLNTTKSIKNENENDHNQMDCILSLSLSLVIIIFFIFYKIYKTCKKNKNNN